MRIYTGSVNANWKGGLFEKNCVECGAVFSVKFGRKDSARYCSLACWNIYQRRTRHGSGPRRQVKKNCEQCGKEFSQPQCHAWRYRCCSKKCSDLLRRVYTSGPQNPNWSGGISRLPYPYNFRELSKRVIAHYGGVCQNPFCDGTDSRMTTHHIDHEKSNNDWSNLIALCATCNSRANFNREKWCALYRDLVSPEMSVCA